MSNWKLKKGRGPYIFYKEAIPKDTLFSTVPRFSGHSYLVLNLVTERYIGIMISFA